MTDQERQAQALRRGLDEELGDVRATPQARERLVRATTARSRRARARASRERRRLRPALALPLAGALVAAVIVSAIMVPQFLRAGPDSTAPAGGVPSPGPTRGPAADPTSDPIPDPTVPSITRMPSTTVPASEPATTPAADPSPVRAVTPSSLQLRVDDASPEPGQRIAVSILEAPARYTTIAVQWGDGSPDEETPGSCSRASRSTAAAPLTHTYPRSGTYRVTVTLDRCGTREQARLTVTVLPLPTPSATR